MLKGSNKIVCVLLVSNSRGCCLAAPGDHECAVRVIAPQRDLAVCLKAEFQMHTVVSNKMANSTQLSYIRVSAGRYVFQWDRLLDEGLAFVQAGVLSWRWRDVPLEREFQMWCRRCKQLDPHWFQGRQMRFWWMWSTISWRYFMIYPLRLFSTADIFNQALLHPIFKSLLACDIKISLDMLWIGVNCIFKENMFFFMYWLISFSY